MNNGITIQINERGAKMYYYGKHRVTANVARILAKPYAVVTSKGDWLYFSDQSEAQKVSMQCRWLYMVFLVATKSWVTIGIIDN